MSHEPWLTRQARERPDHAAVDSLSFAEVHDRAARAAGALGIGPGDRVAIALPPGTDFAIALHACLLAGAIAVPVDLRLPDDEQAARRTGAKAAVYGPPPLGDPIEPHCFEPDDVAVVMHTSGTTDRARPVALTYGNLEASATANAAALGLGPGDWWLCPLPVAHVAGLMILIRGAVVGLPVLIDPPPFDPRRLAERLNAGEANLVSMVPTMLQRVLDAGLYEPQQLRLVMLGGGPVDPALLARAEEASVHVVDAYGLTETASGITVDGRPLPGVDIEIAPDGEIVVSGPMVAGGTLRTGDLGRFDAGGRLEVIGRKADTIVSGGENVAPAEVEAVLLAHPLVAEAGVFGRPDAEWGEAVCAHVVMRGIADVEELRDWCRERLAPFQVPKTFVVVPSLPRTPSGKLLRRALR